MTSVISRQENAGAMCSAVTFCETSRMRRRYFRQRLREAAASNPCMPVFGTEAISAPHHVIRRRHPQLVQVLPAPGDHFCEPFLPADLRLPSHVALDGAGIEPVPRVLPETVGRHLAQLLEGHAERFR